MRTALRVFGWGLGVLVLIPVFALLAAVLLLNLDPGRRLVERLAGQLTAGQVRIAGLAGRFPDALRLRHAEVSDAQGVWLTLDDVALDWSPLALLHREARVDLLQGQPGGRGAAAGPVRRRQASACGQQAVQPPSAG